MTTSARAQANPATAVDSAAILQGYEQLQRVSAGMSAILALLEQQSETSEATFSVYCLVDSLKSQMEQALERIAVVH
jgi:hypothetical protein